MISLDSHDFNGKRALIRVDFNVPLNDEQEVTDNTRMVAAIPTIMHVLSNGGSAVLMSHLGRPKNGPTGKSSLEHLVGPLGKLIGKPVNFVDDCIGKNAEKASSNLKPGEVLLLENLRFHREETKGDKEFAKKLSKHGDIYVNDAFGTAHRAHASTTIIAEFFTNKCFGKLLSAEIDNAQRVLENAKAPFTAIIGGAKVSSKIEVITNLLDRIDHLIIGGGMAYTFIKAQGGSIGNSLVEADYLETALEILKTAKTKNVSIHLPEDSVIADGFSNDAETKIVDSGSIESGWMGLDVGEKALADYALVLKKSKTILWNGPVGVFEFSKFENGTRSLGKQIALATKNGAFSLVGGGDSVAAAKKFGVADHMSYISTGGGALLEFLEGKILPGVAAIQD